LVQQLFVFVFNFTIKTEKIIKVPYLTDISHVRYLALILIFPLFLSPFAAGARRWEFHQLLLFILQRQQRQSA